MSTASAHCCAARALGWLRALAKISGIAHSRTSGNARRGGAGVP
jgi:hypothetical protein